MAVQAKHRIYRTRISILAAAIVTVLAIVLYLRVGTEPARIVLEATGTVTITLIIAQFVIEKWLWKTKLGRLIGFPPDYSGKWTGIVHRIRKHEEDYPTETPIEVEVKQSMTQIEWNQIGFDSDGNELTESRLILGEVVDYHSNWDGIVGVYEVTRHDGFKDEGMQLLKVKESDSKISGLYCGMNGNVGKMELTKKESN